MKKYIKLKIVFMTVILILLSSISVYASQASNKISTSALPTVMPPGTVIRFDANLVPAVIDVIETPSFQNQPSRGVEYDAGSQAEKKKEEAIIARIREEARRLPIYIAPAPEVYPGTIVTYGTDGQVNDIKHKVIPNAYKALPQGTRKPAGVYTYGINNSQTITITNSSVLGEGRFTVFEDTIGDHDNLLETGDCATKGDYDNPFWGTVISARATDTDIQKYMVKNDNGALPNAVLDIWQWSPNDQYFGYYYSSTLSFPGRYYYEF